MLAFAAPSLTGDFLPPKTFEEHLFFLIYQTTPSIYELSSYNSQIQRFIAKDLEPHQFYTHVTEENLLNQLVSFHLDTNRTYTHLMTRAFIITANILNIRLGRTIILPNQKLNLTENVLFIIGKKHTDRFLIQKVTNFMIHWMDEHPLTCCKNATTFQG